MSVTTFYYRLDDVALDRFRDDPEDFEPEAAPDGGSIEVPGELCMLVEDLAGRAIMDASQKALIAGAVSGFAGVAVNDDDDFPYLIDRELVTRASGLMTDIRMEDLRLAADLDRLKAQHGDVEEWLWEDWGPNVVEEQLLPAFDSIRSLYRGAAEQDQHVVVGWY